MLVEGIGIKPPQKVQVRMTESELITLFRMAEERASHRSYKTRADQWGRGLKQPLIIPGVGELSQETRPIFVGTLGEYAVLRHLSARFPGQIKLDTKLNAAGDFGVDLTAFRLTMQVKTRQSDFPLVNRVRRTNGRGQLLPFRAEAFCFCEWTGGGVSYISGWQWTKYLVKKPLVDSVGDWKNIEVEDRELLPMSRLLDELEGWKGASSWR